MSSVEFLHYSMLFGILVLFIYDDTDDPLL